MSNVVGIFSHVQPLFGPDELSFTPRTEPPPRRPEEIPDPASDDMEEFRRLAGLPVEERRETFRRMIDSNGADHPFVVPDRDMTENYRRTGEPSVALFSTRDYLWLVAAFALVVVAAAFVLYRLT